MSSFLHSSASATSLAVDELGSSRPSSRAGSQVGLCASSFFFFCSERQQKSVAEKVQ